MSYFISHEDGVYAFTKAGCVLLVILLVAIIILAAFLLDRKNTKYSIKQIVFTGVCLALAFALSFVRVINMPLGGSVTLCSMFFVCLVGYFYGPKMGIVAGLAFGFLQLTQDGGKYMLTPFQVGCDYIFAFMALGVAGFFYKKKNGLLIGYIVAALLRGVFHSIGGYLYWMDGMPDSFPANLKFLYPVAYNYAYILPELIVTVVIICIPAFRKAVDKVKNMASDK